MNNIPKPYWIATGVLLLIILIFSDSKEKRPATETANTDPINEPRSNSRYFEDRMAEKGISIPSTVQ
ncbi:hypothetical protein VSS37_13155 [Candidatus Thiothrix sp. Deng01]|uniref:Uncharacterized protein n=1 Tax=Candidatus Thiothrix phosphatis TaxID=3112415 RepID=A0ABU6D0P3_9GAMM|nr:hypothetical protein [Candidatus Thiothrix sp. Deng01]MEB4591934.1 hypothetical protein [Candidatus Thiothrix sp. Deng01]